MDNNDNNIVMMVDMLTWFGFGDVNVATSTEKLAGVWVWASVRHG